MHSADAGNFEFNMNRRGEPSQLFLASIPCSFCFLNVHERAARTGYNRRVYNLEVNVDNSDVVSPFAFRASRTH